MDRKIVKNYLYNTVYQFLIIALPIITTPYISRVLSVGDLGIYNYSLTIMTYFTFVASLGFHIYGQKEIAKAQNQEQRNTAFSSIFTLRLSFGIAVAGIYFLLVFFFFPHKLVYFAQGIGLLASNIDVSWYYAGKENYKVLTIRNIAIKLISVFILFAFVRGSDALLKYTLSISLPNLIGNISLFYRIDVKYYKLELSVKTVKKIIFSSVILFLPTLVQQLYSVIDTTILGALSSNEQVGYYSQTFKLINMGAALTYSIGTVLLPRIVSDYNEGRVDNVKINMRGAVTFILHISIPLMVGTFCIADIFVPWFYGQKYISIISLIMLASPLMIITSLSNLLGTQFLIGVNKERRLFFIILFGSCCNILLDLMLIPRSNAIGALIATLIAESIILILCVVSCKSILRTNLIEKGAFKSIISALIMGGFILVLKQLPTMPIILKTFVLVILGVVVYFVILWFFKDPFVKNIIKFVRNRQ